MLATSASDSESLISRPAATVAGSANLLDAVIAEGRNRRLALMLTLMAFAAAEKPATDGAAHGLQLR